MNKIDKDWYKALRFLSRLSVDDRLKIEREDPKKYRKYVPEDVEYTLDNFGYLTTLNNVKNTVTQSGLQQLRDLEDIRRKDLTIKMSTTALVISLVSLIISIFF